MSFVVDGLSWDFGALAAEDVQAALDAFLDRVEVASRREETVWIGDDLQSRPVYFGADLWSLWGPDSPVELSNDLWQRLTAWLLRAPHYADESQWPPGMDDINVEIDDQGMRANPDVAWAHHSVRAGQPVACLTLKPPGGRHKTTTAAGTAEVHWVASEEEHRGFFRDAVEVVGDSEQALERFAPHAFPDIYFLPGVWSGLGDLKGGYSPLGKEIRKYLRIFDDHGSWAFMTPPPVLDLSEAPPESEERPSNQTIKRRFIRLGLVVEPENPSVRDNGRTRVPRERALKGRTLYCEWHAKLEPHQNRIHLHGPVPESDDKLVVAIFTEHLP